MSQKSSLRTESCCAEVAADPDCLRCMRKKLRAVSVVVFFREGAGWRLDRFEGDKPLEAAEVEFQYMLKSGVPDAIASHGSGMLLTSDAEISEAFPRSKSLFLGQSLIAAPVQFGKIAGVRLAWREQSDPFSRADLTEIACESRCPDGCVPSAAHGS